VDKRWSKIMSDAVSNPNVIAATSIENRLQDLETLSDDLDRCQKSLSEYLDSKRCAFPRFYFISDDELLSILGSTDCTCVQEHMLKLYDNCKSLIFGRGNKIVT